MVIVIDPFLHYQPKYLPRKDIRYGTSIILRYTYTYYTKYLGFE